MSTGAKQSNQEATQSGPGLSGTPNAPVRKVPAFQGSAGQGDNQSTDRPKGST